MVQVGARDAGRIGDALDFRLLAPMLGDIGDSPAHYAIILGGGGERGEIDRTIG